MKDPIVVKINQFLTKDDFRRASEELKKEDANIIVLPSYCDLIYPELIKCKDCKYFERRSIYHHGLCDVHCNGVGEKEVTSEDQYCSWAERKEE